MIAKLAKKAPPRIGLFGGSFDPVHFGHLLIACDAIECLALDELWWIPSAQNPLKAHSPLATNDQRWQMLQAAVEGQPQMKVLDLEFHRPNPSYTVDTLREIRKKHSQAEIFWLMGQDQLSQLSQWKDIESWCSSITFAIYHRPDSSSAIPDIPGLKYRWLPRREISISSTEIRERIQNGKPVDFFTPVNVIKLIKQMKLYLKKL
jgi:nicotinate-nucleotide adenylyltransferase